MSTNFPILTHLARAYLHQDYMHEYVSARAAVEDFFTGGPGFPDLVAVEIDRALMTYTTEHETRAFVLDELDSSYLVERDGLTYRGWLQSVADRARELGR